MVLDLFERLLDDARQISTFTNREPNPTEEEIREACEAYTAFLMQSVAEHPALATLNIMDEDRERSSLLSATVKLLGHESAQPAIQFLIGRNPSSLLWKPSSGYHHSTTLANFIAAHDCHYILMPWIATDHKWVLDEFLDTEVAPDRSMLFGFLDGRVTESVLRNFWKVYPRHLFCQKHNYYRPMRMILTCDEQVCSFEFFRWLIDRYPRGYNHGFSKEETILKWALVGFFHHQSEDMDRICLFIIEEHPEKISLFECFSFYDPAEYFFRQAEKNVLERLLEIHSEPSVLIHPRDNINKLVRQLKSLLDERKDLKEEVSFLRQGAISLLEATACSKKVLFTGLSSVFDSWSTTVTKQLERKVDEIQISIDQTWTNYEEERNAQAAR